MRTKTELLDKLDEMIAHRDELYKIVNNPPDDMSFEEIKENISYLDEQCGMIALMEWVLAEEKKEEPKTKENTIPDWNYFLDEGDKVAFNPILEEFTDYSNGFIRKRVSDYNQKVGIVTECHCGLHGYGIGSSYYCTVDFEGEQIKGACGWFVKIDE